MATVISREHIAERRRQFMSVDRSDIPDDQIGHLYRRAIAEYGATCLWNCRPSPTVDGMATIAERLMIYGDLRAWYLADEILETIGKPANALGYVSG